MTLKRLFLSIIILSALASESGASFSADLIEYCLVNITQLDIVQDNRNVIVNLDLHKELELDKVITQKGIPIAIYSGWRLGADNSVKFISKDPLNEKEINIRNRELFLNTQIAITKFVVIVSIICFIFQKLFIARHDVLSLADSSPPALC